MTDRASDLVHQVGVGASSIAVRPAAGGVVLLLKPTLGAALKKFVDGCFKHTVKLWRVRMIMIDYFILIIITD